MAFQNKNLSVLAYANGFTLWRYQTDDKIDDVNGKYFDGIGSLINVGDIFLICAKDGAGFRIVESINGKTITMGNLK